MAVDFNQFAGQFPPQVLQAVAALFAAKPEAEQKFLTDARGDLKGYLDSVVGWFSDFGSQVADKLDQFGPELGLLDALGFEVDPAAAQAAGAVLDANGQPLEQALLQTALPGLLNDVAGDAGRQTLVRTLSDQAIADTAAARTALSPEANAARLAAEQAQAAQTASTLSASSATAATQQLAALQASVAAMQQNLTGDLAAKAAALNQQVAAFTANLTTLDATQKSALAEQIAANQQNLEASIAAQRQALTTEIAGLRGAADAQSAARRSALQAEIAGLTAAQEPMNAARLASATALTTAINLGAESTADALTAQRAKQGYLGSSTFSDAAMARANIGARQQAAQAMGGAREANAADMRTIGARGATEGRSIADEYANNLLAIGGREATGGRSLSDVLATGTRTIGDTGAAGTAAIRNNTGTGLFNIGNAGAAQTYSDQVGGSTQSRTLLDTLATGGANIASTQATQQQAARDAGTTASQGYFDNAYTRGLAGQLALPGLSTALTGTLTNLGNYGNSGLNRTQNALGWWQTNPGAAPTPGVTSVVANNAGNDLSGFGAGLVGTGFNWLNATGYGRAGVGAPTTYDEYLKLYPNSSAANPGG